MASEVVVVGLNPTTERSLQWAPERDASMPTETYLRWKHNMSNKLLILRDVRLFVEVGTRACCSVSLYKNAYEGQVLV
jgi:hypothetical protein